MEGARVWDGVEGGGEEEERAAWGRLDGEGEGGEHGFPAAAHVVQIHEQGRDALAALLAHLPPHCPSALSPRRHDFREGKSGRRSRGPWESMRA